MLCHLLGALGALRPANLDDNDDVFAAIMTASTEYGKLERVPTFKTRPRRSAFGKVFGGLKLKGYLKVFKLAAKNPAAKKFLLKAVKSKALRKGLLNNQFGRKVKEAFFKWVRTTAGQGAINKARKILGDLLF